MSPNPSINTNRFLSLAEINRLLPGLELTKAEMSKMVKGHLVISMTDNGLRKVHLGSLFELLNLHIL